MTTTPGFDANYHVFVQRSGVEQPVKFLATTRWEAVAAAKSYEKKGEPVLGFEMWDRKLKQYVSDDTAMGQLRDREAAKPAAANKLRPVDPETANKVTILAGTARSLATAARRGGVSELEADILAAQAIEALASLGINNDTIVGLIGAHFPGLVRKPRQEATA